MFVQFSFLNHFILKTSQLARRTCTYLPPMTIQPMLVRRTTSPTTTSPVRICSFFNFQSHLHLVTMCHGSWSLHIVSPGKKFARCEQCSRDVCVSCLQTEMPGYCKRCLKEGLSLRCFHNHLKRLLDLDAKLICSIGWHKIDESSGPGDFCCSCQMACCSQHRNKTGLCDTCVNEGLPLCCFNGTFSVMPSLRQVPLHWERRPCVVGP